MPSPQGPSTYRQLLGQREYAGLLLGRVVSLVGDQLSRVALTVLVYDRTASALLSAAAYAVTYVPAVVGGPLLGGLADRLPRRRLLVGADLLRAALLATMAVPGMPLAAMFALVFLSCAVQAPWAAARAPLMREVLVDDDGYRFGTGLDEVLDNSGQIVGFAGAGALLVVLEPRAALLLDAASFLVSALVVRLTVRHRPAAAAQPPAARGRVRAALADAQSGWRAATAPACRRPLLVTWVVVSASIAPEALAAPWAAALGAGSVAVGLLFAAGAFGNLLAVLVVSRARTELADRLLVPLAVVSLAPLVACLLHPPLLVALALVVVSGAGSSCSMLARVAFVRGVDPAARGRAFALAAAGVTGLQGVAIAAVGLAATLVPPPTAVGLAGVVGLVLLGAVVQLSPRPGAAVDPSHDALLPAAPGARARTPAA